MTTKVNKFGIDTSQGLDFFNDMTINSNTSSNLTFTINQSDGTYTSSIQVKSGNSYSLITQKYVNSTDSFVSFTGSNGSFATKKLIIGYDSFEIKNNANVTRHLFSSAQADNRSFYTQINDGLCSILSSNSSYSRWQLVTKSQDAETGSNVGSDFGVYRYSDVGVQIDRPFWIYRSTGKIEFTKSPNVINSIPLNTNNGDLVSSRFVHQTNKSGGNKNILFNPFFQINQEVNTSPKSTGVSAGGAFVLDGWKIKSLNGVAKNVTFNATPAGGFVTLPDSNTLLEQKIMYEDMPQGVYVINPLVDSTSTSVLCDVTIWSSSGTFISSNQILFSSCTKKSTVSSSESNSSAPWGFGNLSSGLVIDTHDITYGWITIKFTGPCTIYGCQIEIGEVPSRIESNAFSEELDRCKKFYQKSYPYAVAPRTVTPQGSRIAMAANSVDFYDFGQISFPITMRDIPTVNIFSTLDGAQGAMRDHPSNANYATGQVVISGTSGCHFNFGPLFTATANRVYSWHWVADARV